MCCIWVLWLVLWGNGSAFMYACTFVVEHVCLRCSFISGVLYCIVQYCIVCIVQCMALYCIVLYSMGLYCNVQCVYVVCLRRSACSLQIIQQCPAGMLWKRVEKLYEGKFKKDLPPNTLQLVGRMESVKVEE